MTDLFKELPKLQTLVTLGLTIKRNSGLIILRVSIADKLSSGTNDDDVEDEDDDDDDNDDGISHYNINYNMIMCMHVIGSV